MNRRGFLRFLGLGAAAAVAPTKTYAFFGGILRPKAQWTINRHTYEMLERQINPPLVLDWIDIDRLVAEVGGNLGIAPEIIARTRPFIGGLNSGEL